ncbi:CotH kinase family protein [Bacillus sp. SJS]|uniref:CotH kinase family protein n=1 Tax=Bacillus sp. SJS TaxID=1423321 RepID=UPI0004DD1A56|nr:CotH kinase family protein [Bacillus sp. SJS]
MNSAEASIKKLNCSITPRHLTELRRDLWNDEPLPTTLVFQDQIKVHAEIAYRGAHTRKAKKKSYFINHAGRKKVKGEREFHLNAEYYDPSFMRNALSFKFLDLIGLIVPHWEYVKFYINGKYEGIYLKLESVNEDFAEKHRLNPCSIIYAIDGDANFSLHSDLDKSLKKNLLQGYELKSGNKSALMRLTEFIVFVNTATHQEFEKRITEYINVRQYLSWLAGVVCLQNFDGFVHNYALLLDEQTNQFIIIPWDYDATFGRDVNGTDMGAEYVRIEGYNTLSARLLAIESFKNIYAGLMNSLLDQTFTTKTITPMMDDLFAQLEPEVQGDPYVGKYVQEFRQEPRFIKDFIQARNDFLSRELSSRGWK